MWVLVIGAVLTYYTSQWSTLSRRTRDILALIAVTIAVITAAYSVVSIRAQHRSFSFTHIAAHYYLFAFALWSALVLRRSEHEFLRVLGYAFSAIFSLVVGNIIYWEFELVFGR